MGTVWRDIRFAFHMLRSAPGVTLAAVLALALGIGANSAVFSVVNGVLLRPLPYRNSQELLMMGGAFKADDHFQPSLSYPEYQDLRDQSRTLSAVGVFMMGDANVTGGGQPAEHLQAGVTSASLFPLLDVQPILGRNFLADEEQKKGQDHVVLISWSLWQRRFNGDAQVLGKSLEIDRAPYKIVGVLPKSFQMQPPCEAWVPLSTANPAASMRDVRALTVWARVKPGTRPSQVRDDLDAVAAREREIYPKDYASGGWTLQSKPLIDVVVGDARLGLFVLLGAVALVLLIACGNVANLLLARAAARTREMALRSALGARRRRLIRQMLTESMVLSALGGALGVLLGAGGVEIMMGLRPDALPRTEGIGVDGRVLLFTALISVLTGALFGLVPALSASRPDLTQALKDGSRGSSGSRGRLRGALVIAELALSLMLLVGTGLLLRSFLKVRAVDCGFRSDHVLTVSVAQPVDDGPITDAEGARFAEFFARTTERLAQLPGTQAAGAISTLPLDGNSWNVGFEIEGYIPRNASDKPNNELREVTPGYFEALRISLVSGRFISAADTHEGRKVVVVNQSMAKRWWPGEIPLGKRIKIPGSRESPQDWWTVVGIVGDVRGFGLDQPARPEVYVPHAQFRSSPAMSLVLRTAGDPRAYANSARRVINEIDLNQAVFNIRTMDEVVASSLAKRQFALEMMLAFGLVALVLAALGIYGVMSYTVAQRIQEIGIRVALGARPVDVLWMVVRQGMTLVALGLGIGVAGALAVSRVLSALLYGVGANDAVTYLATITMLSSVALIAILIPAGRATRVEPMIALRAE